MRNRHDTIGGGQAGFSIVELMVAMLISLLLLAGVLSVMYTSRITYDENARIARLQEYARSSVELLLRDLRSSGQNGCGRPIQSDSFRNLLNGTLPSSVRYNFALAVQGYDGTSGAFVPTMPTNAITGIPSATPGNDVIVIRSLRADIPPMRLATAYAGGTANLPVDRTGAATLPAGTPLIVSDCRYANIITNSAAVGGGANVSLPRATGTITVGGAIQTPANTATALPAYAAGSLVTAIETSTYYIRASATGSGPSLWRISGNNPPEELVEGVERLEIQYGEDTTGDRLVDVYRAADAVANWANVLSVSLAVLMRSPDQSIDSSGGALTYDMLGTVVGPFNDRRPRLLFTTTAAVRNRAI